MHNIVEQLSAVIAEIKRLDSVTVKRLDLNLLEKAIAKMAGFADDCAECKDYLTHLRDYLLEFKERQDLSKSDLKDYQKVVKPMMDHLQRKHQIVTAGYYVGIYLAMGASIGLIFGLVVFDNLALGLPLGIAIGLAIGSAKDAEAKKKGLTL